MREDDERGLIRVAAGEGEHFAVTGATLTWKVRSRQADGAFCFFEQQLAPGEGVSLHTHSYPEAFYVLSGTVGFASTQGTGPITHCNAGDVVLAQPHIRHSFINPGPAMARVLSISVAAHESFFDAVEAADKSEPFAALAPAEVMARIEAIGAQTDTNFRTPSSIAAGAERSEAR